MLSKKNVILIIASMGTFVEALDIAIINLTIPAIQAQFGVSSDTVQWLQTLYVLFFGGFLIIGGKLSDIKGRKLIFMSGSFLFLISSLGAGLSTSFISLALFRALQGLAAALIMPSALSIVTHTFTDTKERSKAIGIFSSFAAIGSGSGLSVGGLISTYWGWHWVFLINVPVLVLVLLGSGLLLQSDQKTTPTAKTDYFSGLVLVCCLLLLTFGIQQLAESQIHWNQLFASLGGALLLFFYLVRRLKTHVNPLIDLSIFQIPSVLLSNVVFFTLGAYFIGFLFLVSLMLQQDMNYSAATSGLLLVPFSILSAAVAKFGIPMILKRLGIEEMGVLGMGLMFCGGICLNLAIFFDYSLGLVLLAAAFISGLGMTISYTSLSVLSIRDVSSAHYGLASSLTGTTYSLGAGIGLCILSLFMKILPTQVAVGYTSAMLLSSYALLGMLILVLTVLKSRAIVKTPAVPASIK